MSPSSRGSAREPKGEGSTLSTAVEVTRTTSVTVSTRDLDQSDRILDRGQWARVLNRADAQLARDVPVIPLFEVPAVVAVRSSVRNFVPNFLDSIWNAEDWWLER